MTDDGKITCYQCDNTVPNHRWGKIKAVGWFFAKGGTAFCPEHVPEWVEGWRAKRQCIMAGCDNDVAAGMMMCEPHYAQAHPDERGMASIREHVVRENAVHPISTEFARRRHERTAEGADRNA